MKYLKAFDHRIISKNVNEGDYIVAEINGNDNISNFINNNIGHIVLINNGPAWLSVTYENVPDNIMNSFTIIEDKYNTFLYNYTIHIDDVKYYARTKEELEFELTTNKFNL